jgi:hypothetical protein
MTGNALAGAAPAHPADDRWRRRPSRTAYAHHFQQAGTNGTLQAHTLKVAVYQVENTPKFKVHFENYDNSPVVLRIRNAAHKILHEEVVRDGKYVRKFDLAT